MKSLIFHLLLWTCLFMSLPFCMNAQSVIKPENDSTFIAEFRDGDEWAVIARHGFVVGLSNQYIRDDYGKFYQLTIRIRNLTERSYTFDPDTVRAFLVNKRNDTIALKVYSSEGFQKKIKRTQTWNRVLAGISAGLEAGTSGYETSYVSRTSVNGYSYLQPISSYNHSAAAQANALNGIQLYLLDKEMEEDRRTREEGYLKKTTIHPGESILGFMNVKRKKGLEMRVVIPLNGQTYVFDWDVSKKKK